MPQPAPSSPPDQQGKTAFTRRYRSWYSKLPANLQLIGLQLWLPLFFVIMFCVCYVGAFHAPSFHGLNVGVVSSDAAEGAITQLEDKVAITEYATVSAAKEAVLNGEVTGVYHAGEEEDYLYVAGAVQMQAGMIASQVFSPVSEQSGRTLTNVDVAPLPPHDAFGMTAMYLMLAICIGGYMVGMFLGMMGAPLRHRIRILTLVVSSAVLSLVIATFSSPLLGAIDGHFWSIWGLAFAWMFVIGVVVNGIGYYAGRFVASVAMIVFIFLSVPASGAALPISLMPEVFQSINGLVVGSGITEMLKYVMYGVGPGLSHGFTQMAAYLGIGLVLSVTGKRHWEIRYARKILKHETTMFTDAQKAAAEYNRSMRAEIFKDAGLELPEDVAKRKVAEDNVPAPVATVVIAPQSSAEDSGEKQQSQDSELTE